MNNDDPQLVHYDAINWEFMDILAKVQIFDYWHFMELQVTTDEKII